MNNLSFFIVTCILISFQALSFFVATTTLAAPAPEPDTSSYSVPPSGGGGGSGGYSASSGGSYGGGRETVECAEGQVKHSDGSCVTPMISRNIFVFAAPKVKQPEMITPNVPMPKLNYNIVFVKTPENPGGVDPIVVPPPQEKTLVYVLSRKPEAPEQQVIEMPMKLNKPEVYYVNYEDGENLQLPGANIDLQSALASSAQQEGQLLINQGEAGGPIPEPKAPSGSYGAPPPPSPNAPSSSYGAPQRFF